STALRRPVPRTQPTTFFPDGGIPMRTLLCRCSLSFAMVALLLACACGLSEHSSPGARADGPADKASLALDGFDPVLLVAGKEVKGKPATSLTRGGFRYLFVDAANKGKFEKDPERYEIQFQGRCAVHRGAPARPDVFTVHKGRIYCFACEDCREAFRQ